MQLPPEELWTQSWDLYNESLYRHCFFRLHDKEKARDAVQEIYFRFWKYITTSGNVVDSPQAFLFRIARNLIVDTSRKPTTDSLEESIEVFMVPEQSVNAEYDADLFTDFSRSEIQQAIEKLPKHYQTLLYMRFFEDLEPQEMAEILELSANLVSVGINRAVHRLRELLKH